MARAYPIDEARGALNILGMALPPGPRISGAFGLLKWMWDPIASFEELSREFGDLLTVTNPIVGVEVIVSHPELIKQVFTGSTDVFLGGAPNRMLSPIVGDRSVLVLDGKEHHRERKLLMPPFHGERLGVYAGVIAAATERALDEWPREKAFSLLPGMQEITFSTILRSLFGDQDDETIDRLRGPLLALVNKAQSPLGMMWLHPKMQHDLGPLTGWASILDALRAADAMIYSIVARARGNPTGGTDVLSMLLAARDESGAPMTDGELRDELITFLLAGHETTATALCWAVEEIARRPEVLARIRDEAAGATSLAQPMPYLDSVIKEVLRLRPIVPLLIRTITRDVPLREYVLPAGTAVVPCPYLAQRHPDYFDAPNEFRGDRFVEKKPDPYAWIPFGGGARRCIGMAFALFEMRVVLATVLARVEVDVPRKPARVALRSFMFAPKGGPRVVLHPRATTSTPSARSSTSNESPGSTAST